MSKSILAFGICFLLICSVFIPMSLGYNIRISKIEQPSIIGNRNTLYVGGSGPDNYTKIQDAIDNASDGYTVFVFDDSAPYYEDIIIEKSINLIGENKDTTIIIGSNDIIHIEVDNVKISRFTVQDGDNSINLDGNSCSIINNNFHYFEHSGIYAHYCNNHIISNNNFITHSDNIYQSAIHFAPFKSKNGNCIIRNNSIISSIPNSPKRAILFSFKTFNDNILEGNYMKNFYAGIQIDIKGNNNIISNNIFENNYAGIFLVGNRYSKVSSNAFLNNELGISVTRFSRDNSIIKNNFIDNDENAEFHWFSFRNTWDGNYWDEPRTNPYIIIGRLFMFLIPWINIDWNPAKEPYDIGI